MSLAKVYWTRKVALVVVLTVGILSGGQGRFAAAAPQIIETTITKDRLAGADFGALPPGVDTVKLILNGPYDPKTNPKGYTGSAIYPPEGSIWKKTVDAQGRHIYQIAITSQTDSTLLASTTTCTGSGSGPCDETKTCTITTDGANGCGGNTSLSAQSVPTKTKAERLSKSEPGGGVRMPQMLSGSSFPDARNIHRVPHRTIHVNVTPQKAKTKAKSTTDTIGYLRFTITGKGVALYRKAGKKQITEDTQISVGPKGLDEDFYFVTNGDFKEPVTIQSHFTYADSEKAETYYTPPNCKDQLGTVPCCIPTVVHLPPDPYCSPCDGCNGVTLYGSIILPQPVGTGGGLGYNSSIYNNPTNTNLYDSGNPCGQSSNSTSATRSSTGDTINGVFPTGINFGNGMNQLVREWPFISFAMGEKAYTMLVVFGGQEMFWFDGSSNSNNYTARYGAKHTLTYDPDSHFFILTQPDGTVYKFNNLDDDQTNPPGLFYESVSPDGKISRVTQYVDTNGDQNPERIGEIRRGTLVNEQFVATDKLVYSFVHPQQGTVDYLQDVTTSRSTDGTTWTPIRKVAFTYNTAGDQETVSELVPNGQNGWNLVGTRCYRYWDNHLVKYFFEPQAYANLVAAVSNPLQAEDSAVAPFASHYYQYDSSRRVTRHDQLGGTKSSTFSYSTWVAQEGQVISLDSHFYQDTVNLNPNTPNQWMTKITETWTDNSQAQTTEVTRTTYANQLGQPIIKDLVCGDSRWIEYYKYDDNYRLILHAEPSAIAGCDTTVSNPESSTVCRVGCVGHGPLIYEGNWTSVPASIRQHCEDELEEYQRTWPYISHPNNYPYYVSVYHLLIQRSAASSASFKLDANNEEKVGLVHIYTYDDANAPGYLHYEKLRQGYRGGVETDDVYLRETVRTSHSTTDGTTVYPISVSRILQGDISTGAIATNYSYTYHAGTNAIAERITTLPAIDPDHNGSDTSNVRKETYDVDGHVLWSLDERGSFTYNTYDPVTGAIVQTIQDVKSGQSLTPPTGWGDLPTSGLHVMTDYTHDIRGRITQTLGPAHLSPLPSGEGQGEGSVQVRTASWTVYDDANHTIRTAQGYQVVGTSAYVLINPISITKTDLDGRVIEQIQAVRGSGVTSSGALSSSDTFSQSSYTRWSGNTYSNTLLTSSRVYHLIPSSGAGTVGTNYAETTYTYNSVGRVVKTIAPNGTIQRGVLDIRGHVVKSYVGTSDTDATNADPTGGSASGNNMVLLAENQYDGGGCSCGANGNITQTTRYVDASTTRVTSYTYDWRDRRLTSSTSDGTTTYIRQNTYDNLNRVTQTDWYHTAAQDANLVGRSKKYYDELGRVYKTETYAVDPSTGTAGTVLADNTWYDSVGNVIKQKPAGSGAFKKTAYDSLGRVVKRYVGYDTTESSYVDAGTIDGDTIFEHSETSYDAVGNVIFVTNRSRLHDATGTGELTTPDGRQPKARVSYAAAWYDPIGRKIATANYGTNSGTAPTRPDSAPTRSDTVLVSSAEYDATGKAFSVTDSAGKVSHREFDSLGRMTKTIQNYVDGGTANDQNVTVETAYTIDGHVSTLTAKNSTTGEQVTRYIYGTTLTDSGVARTDLLRGVVYPDSDDTTTLGSGSDGVYDHVEYKYNRLGEPTEVKDQNGTVHEYVYDAIGRQTADKVTTVGNGVDDFVRRIAKTYEVRGMTEHVTSYDAVTDGNVVNDVLRQYDTLGRLTREYQEHEGVKDANTLYVETAWENIATALRPTSVRYPNGRQVFFDYSGTDDNKLNRLTKILDTDDVTSLAEYTYLGIGTMVIEDFVQPSVKLDYFGGTSGTYAGSDNFGHVVQQLWYDYGASANRDKFTYGYDRASNRLYRNHSLATLKDEFYTYDGVNRLTISERGTLTQNKDDISGTPVREEDFALDPLGNWTTYVQKTNGSTDLNQSRTHNTANELISASSWTTPVNNRAGNITTISKPSSPSNGLTLKYDAWSRLVQVTDGETIVAKYKYDGDNRRIKKHIDSQSPSSPDGVDRYEHLYYIDVQLVETRNATTESDQPESLQPKYQWVWSLRYIDSPILRDENTDTDSLCDDSRLYYLTDANMNVTSLVDTSGDALERYVYDPYGRVTIYNADWTSIRLSSLYSNSCLYAGRDLDAETGLYYYRARYYSAVLGRFTARDPIGYKANCANLYEYVFDSPTNKVDPSGLQYIDPRLIFPPPPPPPPPPADQITIPIQFGYTAGSYSYDWTARWGMENDLAKANEIWAECHIVFKSTGETPQYQNNCGRTNKIYTEITMESKYSTSDFGFKSADSRTSIYVTYIESFKNFEWEGINRIGEREWGGTEVLGRTLPEGRNASENILLPSSSRNDIMAHELGHVLMGPDNSTDESNLMSSPQAGHALTKCDCEKARKKAEELLKKWGRN